jgi:hypothetical protein
LVGAFKELDSGHPAIRVARFGRDENIFGRMKD